MNDILALPRSELLINLMWYRINMDMSNSAVLHHVTELFRDEDGKEQPFISQRGTDREEGFLSYFRSRLSAQYVLPFRIQYDAYEDRVSGNRTKYYLIHASNSLKAVLLMKEVMWPLGDEEGTFDFSGTSQTTLISKTPEVDDLKAILLREFKGQQLAFDDIRGKTWSLLFLEKHYRSALQELRSSGAIEVIPVSSKGKGLAGRDLVRFPLGAAMSVQSTIEWTDATWNPVRGCTKISPGCKFCYAERFAERFRGVPGHPFEQGFDLRLVPEKLADPLRWQTPKMIFVNSMSDLFHEGVPDECIEAVSRVMVQANWHTFQILTKRSIRMRDLLKTKLKFAAKKRNIWWGVSFEDKHYGVPRIAHLRQSGAAVKFLSVEPLIEDIGIVNLSEIDWMIVGGESGPGARPLEARWVRSLRRQCRDSDVKFFFKQWSGVRKHLTGRLLDGRIYNEFPDRTVELAPESARRLGLVSDAQQISRNFIPLTAIAGD